MPTPRSDPYCIEVLEKYLWMFYNHKFTNIAIVAVDENSRGVIAVDYAGKASNEPALLQGIRALANGVTYAVTHWQLPPRDESLDASYVVYNVAHDPLCFDYLVWLVDAEMTRRREGARGPLKVAFWFGTDPVETMKKDNREGWLNNVFRPALALVGAVEDERALRGRHKELFVPRDICAAVRNGERVPILWSRYASIYPGYIVLTLREAEHWPDRNSNLDAWVRFASYLEAEGEKVVFVRDTAKADTPIEGFLSCPQASRDLHCRMALYQSAKCNVMVSNGPIGLCLFSQAPWLQFVKIEHADSHYQANTTMFWRDANGIAAGDQYPWAAPNQRIAWCDDSYDNLVREWEDYRPLLEESNARCAA